MPEFKRSKTYELIEYNNYLINSYISLTRIKSIHFLFIFLEILLNIFQELDIFVRSLKLESKTDFNLNIISLITIKLEKFSPIVLFLLFIFIIIIFDSLYIFMKLKKFKANHIYLIIIINFLELIFFRAGSLILFNLFFCLKENFIIIGYMFFITHLYLVFNNFIFNHLYYFVPEFINYPYDEFSSSFDIILLFIKLLLAISDRSNTTFGKFCFLVLFIAQIFFSFYFLNQIKNKSYLLMKNTFLNKKKLVIFFTKTVISIVALIFGKREINNILFFIICIFLLLIIMVYVYLK